MKWRCIYRRQSLHSPQQTRMRDGHLIPYTNSEPRAGAVVPVVLTEQDGWYRNP